MPVQSTTKRCLKCGSGGEFYVDRRRKDGLTPWCKPCIQEHNRAQYRKFRDDRIQRASTRYHSDPEARAAHARDARKWQYANAESHRAAAKRWRQGHPEACAQFRMAYYWRNRAAQIADAKIRNAQRKGAPGWATPEQIAARFELWGWRCWLGLAGCTGEPETIDHVIAVSRGGTNWPANLRPACKKCNGRKHARDWRAFVTS